MKLIYALIFIGAAGFLLLFYLADHPSILAGSPQRGTVEWYRSHPDALAAENIKCWKLLQETPFAEVDQVMAKHPECHQAYLASNNDG
ncbi:MAG: hypothetical protein JJ693_03440 [Acidithiobacillus sp.]|nr:hypothetical protein [Acidithiobacillus sp.]